MVPLPQSLLNPIVTLLQRGSAASAHLLFAAAGIPIEQSGMLVHIPGLTMEVAPECSSIRSSMMLLVTTTVLAHLLLRSFWRKVVVVAVAIPLSVAKNGLRIFVLGVLTTKVDPSFLTGRLHRQGGVIYFLIALLGIFLLLWILRRGENEKPPIPATGSLEGRSIARTIATLSMRQPKRHRRRRAAGIQHGNSALEFVMPCLMEEVANPDHPSSLTCEIHR